MRDGSGAAARDVAGGGLEAFDRFGEGRVGEAAAAMDGCIRWRWRRSRCRRRRRGSTAIGNFGKGIWISSKNIWTNYKRRKLKKMMMNNEVQKPDNATLNFETDAEGAAGFGFPGMDIGGTYSAMDAARTRDGGSAG